MRTHKTTEDNGRDEVVPIDLVRCNGRDEVVPSARCSAMATTRRCDHVRCGGGDTMVPIMNKTR